MFIYSYYILCSVALTERVCIIFTTHVPVSCGGQKKEWKPLDLELRIVMSFHVGAGNSIEQPMLLPAEPSF